MMTPPLPENAPRRTGLYPGSFDPITRGHLDIIARAADRLCDRLVVSVAVSEQKKPLFSLQERLDMVRAEVDRLTPASGCAITVRAFDSLLIHHAAEMGARMIIRGLRAVSDFEYEFQMTGMNARLNPQVETVFLMASEKHQFISSRFVKEICALGGDIGSFVPPDVARRLREKLGGAAA